MLRKSTFWVVQANNMEKDFQALLSILRNYDGESSDIQLVQKAWDFAKLAHTGQKRKTGESYVSHSLETAKILASWKLDVVSVVAGLLHDTVEDGGATFEDLSNEFGREVSLLVEGVTKLSHLRLRGSTDEEFVENLRKMFLAMAKDVRVVLIKIADRLHNMRTLSVLPPEKRERIAKETLEIFAPLAERLGMGQVKAQLDDLAFPYVYPKEYEKVLSSSRSYYKKSEEHIKKIKKTLLKALAKEGLRVKIDARKKHLYSLWRKLERPEINWDFEKVHDIVALRILVDTVAQCYTSLGIVHAHYKPVPHLGVSDFIAQPKPNGYQSIHTKIFGPGGRIVEIQIRTHTMHELAEYGVAAHWAYSQAKAKGIKDDVLEKASIRVPTDKLVWIRQLAEWQKQIQDSKEFLRAVKFDALSHRNYVFSPKGDVYDLPSGATPVDFAYAVHTDLGEYIKAAKVDGKIVPLDYKLKSGQVVEIIKSKEKRKPSPDWLNFVVTTLARKQIAKSLRLNKKI